MLIVAQRILGKCPLEGALVPPLSKLGKGKLTGLLTKGMVGGFFLILPDQFPCRQLKKGALISDAPAFINYIRVGSSLSCVSESWPCRPREAARTDHAGQVIMTALDGLHGPVHAGHTNHPGWAVPTEQGGPDQPVRTGRSDHTAGCIGRTGRAILTALSGLCQQCRAGCADHAMRALLTVLGSTYKLFGLLYSLHRVMQS